MKRLISFVLTLFAGYACAMFCRHLVLQNLIENERLIIPNLLELTFVKNDGAAFGIFAGKTVLLSVITAAVLISIAVYVVIKRNAIATAELISLSLIVSGGACNLYERLAYGYVVDYINIFILPVFNFADMMVTCGCILLVAYVLFIEPKKQKHE